MKLLIKYKQTYSQNQLKLLYKKFIILKQKISIFRINIYSLLNFIQTFKHISSRKLQMSKDNYSMRLKQIREKYGSSLKEAGPSFTKNTIGEFSKTGLSSYERQIRPTYESRHKQTLFTLSSNSSKLNLDYIDTYTRNEPLSLNSSNLNSDYQYRERNLNNTLNSDKYDKYNKFNNLNSDTQNINSSSSDLLKAKTRDQRLKQIQQIRQSYAQSRNKTIDDWTKNMDNSRRKFKPLDQTNFEYAALRQKNNETTVRNPQIQKLNSMEDRFNKQLSLKNRTQSFSLRNNEDFQNINMQVGKLKKNYQYSKENINTKQLTLIGAANENKFDDISKDLRSYRQDQKYRVYEKENKTSCFGNANNDTDLEYLSRNMRKNESETTSPIRGLMKFDSVQKSKNIQLSDKSYNLSNIDKIQERIQKILKSK